MRADHMGSFPTELLWEVAWVCYQQDGQSRAWDEGEMLLAGEAAQADSSLRFFQPRGRDSRGDPTVPGTLLL